MRQAKVVSILLGMTFVGANPALSLPPPEDVPEEVLRTEIITEARSPIDGKPLSAAQYAELRAQIAQNPIPPTVTPKIRRLIFLLRLRQLIRKIIPI